MAKHESNRKQDHRTVRTPKKREKFFDGLRRSCNVSKACKLAGIARNSAYLWRRDDKAFAAEWNKAIEQAADLLEEEAVRRAVTGVKKPVFQSGRLGHVTEYSDTLLIFLLKGAKPQKYAERKEQKHGGRLTLEQLVCGTGGDE